MCLRICLLILSFNVNCIFGYIVPPSDVDILIGNALKQCNEVKDRTSCEAIDCFYDCKKNECVPLPNACQTGVSNLCFPYCGEKADCEGVQTHECQYNDEDGSCSGLDDDIMKRSPHQRFWEFCDDDNIRYLPFSDGGECTISCDTTLCNAHRCWQEDYPDLPTLCKDTHHKHNHCCEPYHKNSSAKKTATETTTMMTPIALENPNTPDPAIDKHCKYFSDDPIACRSDPLCYFNCEKMACVNRERTSPLCNDACFQYCHDSCGCKTAAGGKCEFHVSSRFCLPREDQCNSTNFEPWECVNEGDYRAFSGALCYNAEDFGHCGVGKNILSVNTNGDRYTDIREVEYLSDTEVPFEDVHHARRKKSGHSALPHPDSELFIGVVTGNGVGTTERQCLRYNIPLEENGFYQLTIKTYEPALNGIGKRMFNIELAEQVVVADLDIYALHGKKNFPLTISISFMVTEGSSGAKDITVAGYPPVPFSDHVKLGFCVGECRLDSRFNADIGKYVVSAFSVIKLGC